MSSQSTATLENRMNFAEMKTKEKAVVVIERRKGSVHHKKHNIHQQLPLGANVPSDGNSSTSKSRSILVN
jgi:hypothetical protein